MLQQAAGDDERDLYFDESSNTWDMSGLRSDLEVYGVTVGGCCAGGPAADDVRARGAGRRLPGRASSRC